MQRSKILKSDTRRRSEDAGGYEKSMNPYIFVSSIGVWYISEVKLTNFKDIFNSDYNKGKERRRKEKQRTR